MLCHYFCRYVEHLLQCEYCSDHNGILIVLEILTMNTADSIVTAINILQIIECSSPSPATLKILFCLYRT